MAASGQVASIGTTYSKPQEKIASNSLTQRALRRLRRDYLTLFAMTVLAILIVLCVNASTITSLSGVSKTATSAERKFLPINSTFHLYDPLIMAHETQPGNMLLPLTSSYHLLGTDNLGRDHLSRLLYAGQVSLGIAVFASIFSIVIGIGVGLFAGYYQGGRFGFIDDIILWFITTLNSIPTLSLLIMLAYFLKPSIPTLILVLTIISWTGPMRLVRGETLANREREYVLSAKAVGASPWRIMYVHILPNVFSILITALAVEIGTLILVESALSFLGLGVREPDPSWGNMLTKAQSFLRQGPHLSIIPGLLIVTTVLSLYLIGDGLRDAFDPRSTK